VEQQLLYLECLNYDENLLKELRTTNLPWYVVEIQNQALKWRQYLCGFLSRSQKPIYLFKRKSGYKYRLVKFRPLYSLSPIVEKEINILNCKPGKIMIEATMYNSRALYIIHYNHQTIKDDEVLIKRVTHGITIYNPRS